MALERTFSIIKPDAVAARHTGEILARFENAGLRIVGLKQLHLTDERAAQFYCEHQNKAFYASLISFMTQGPIVVAVLEGESAISHYRALLGNTNPSKAEAGTVRADFGGPMPANAAHGSDSPQAAAREIAFFFDESELH